MRLDQRPIFGHAPCSTTRLFSFSDDKKGERSSEPSRATPVEKANAQGIRTGGLLPVSMHPARMHNDRALERNLAGDLAGASRSHATGGKVMQAFLSALAGFTGSGGKVPAALVADWKARGEAIVKDQAVAEASRVASAP